MKKEKKSGQKPKEFASRPFGPLKGVRTERQAEPRKAPAPVAKPEIPAGGGDLFLRAVAGVKRLNPATAPGKSGKPAAPKPSGINDEERAVFLRALENLQLDVTFRDEIPEEAPPAARSSNRLRQLRRGTVRIDYELDLHGLTRDEAIEALEAFVGGAYRRGQQAVLVITGKGNNSPGEPVLLKAVMEWLAKEGRDMVSETVRAPKEMGGDGAVVAFIRTAARS